MTRATEITENDPARIERVARAIYMTHWHPGDENPRAQDHRFPPTWENANESVRRWVRAQAMSAIAADDANADRAA